MNLSDEAQELMLFQFNDSPKLKGLIRELVAPLQCVADNLEKLSDGAYIREASGATLDVLARLVGQQRKDMKDDSLRLWIKLRIMLNRSQGTAEDLLDILVLFFAEKPQILINELKPNDVVITFLARVSSPKTLFAIIHAALPLGTRSHFIRAEQQRSFRFDRSSFHLSSFAEYFREGNYG